MFYWTKSVKMKGINNKWAVWCLKHWCKAEALLFYPKYPSTKTDLRILSHIFFFTFAQAHPLHSVWFNFFSPPSLNSPLPHPILPPSLPYPARLVAHFKFLLSDTVTSNNRDPAFSETRRARRLRLYAHIHPSISDALVAGTHKGGCALTCSLHNLTRCKALTVPTKSLQ